MSDLKYMGLQCASETQLWAGNLWDQYRMIKGTYLSMKEEDRPEWLTLDQIEYWFNRCRDILYIKQTQKIERLQEIKEKYIHEDEFQNLRMFEEIENKIQLLSK